MIKIKERKELDQSMVDALSKGGVFYSEGYCRYIESLGDKPVYIFDECFVLFVIVRKRGPFRFARLPVEYFQYSEKECGEAEARRFLDECMDSCRDILKIQWVHQPDTTARFHETPSWCVKIPYSSHIIDTSRPVDEIWNGLKSDNRNRIRKGRTNGIEYKSGGLELLDDFYDIYIQTSERTGFEAAPRDLLKKQFDYFSDYIMLSVVYADGVVQGAKLSYYADVCYGIFAGSAYPAVPGAGNILDWGILEDLTAMGVRKLSMGGARINPAPGSKHAGINRYKLGFGPAIEPCYLFKTVLNPTMYRLYRQADRFRAWLRKEPPSRDIIDQEIAQWLDMNDPKALRQVYGKSLPQTCDSDSED